jgi:hypothetical protein
MPVLFQYAEEAGPIVLYDVWKHPIGETLDLIEWFLLHTMVFFNASFDMFHLCKCYTTFRLCPRDWIPEDHIDEIALKEPEAQDGPCLKPKGILDLMLFARKGPMQSLMARDDIRIKKVPTALAYALTKELELKVKIDQIYFAKKADANAPRWNVFDRKTGLGALDPDFKDVVLRFSPAGGLKFLAEFVLNRKPKFHYSDVEPPTSWRPYELGYAPTALAISSAARHWEVWGTKKTKPNLADLENELLEGIVDVNDPDDDLHGDDKLLGIAWPGVIKQFIDHWATNTSAREYANDDIVYTRDLDKHFKYPEPNDDDSVLSSMVAAVRWHGFKINIEGIKSLLAKAKAIVENSPVNVNKPSEIRKYLYECMDKTEQMVLDETTKKSVLETISNWNIANKPHPAGVRAKEILAVKFAAKEAELYEKLLIAGRFHASFIVIGTLSSRMSGADGLNAQGIKHTFDVRSMFPLAWEGMALSIGDFESFEVTIADAVCQDEALHKDLLSGKKIHAVFGSLLNPGLTYEDILKTKQTDNDLYTQAKQGFFGAILYGGDHTTLVKKLGINENNAKSAIATLMKKYKGISRWRERVTQAFCSMRQPGGIGSAVHWKDPAEFAETFLGFRRYYTLENKICKVLFDLARKPPKHWKDTKIKVQRRDRIQTAGGATASALYGAAFAMQAANTRSAANHEIQSPGAQITKNVQRRVWDIQPTGIHEFKVCPMNIHDEIACVSLPTLVGEIETTVKDTAASYRDRVPLIAIDWKRNVNSWADK